MARPLRVEYADAVYHVTARGNERKTVFYGDADRWLFLEALTSAVERFGLRVPVYCLMPNHYHLVVRTPGGNLSRAMAWLQTTFTVRYNRRRKRSGHLFQGRFKAVLVEADEYARQLIAYIHLNPVRAGLKKGVLLPRERQPILEGYRWSSHRVYSGRERRLPGWLDPSWLGYFGRNRRVAVQAYRQYVNGCFRTGLGTPWDEVRRSLVLGGTTLMETVAQALEEKGGREERDWVEAGVMEDRKKRAQELALEQKEPALQYWIRVELGGEGVLELARQEGYADASGVTHAIARLKVKAAQNRFLKKSMEQIKNEMSIVKR